jgi:NADPH-dependent F420 reductase
MRIGLIGGTGREGKGLALRWTKAGHRVSIGSRDAHKARERAAELTAAGLGAIEGGSNESIVAESEIALLSVPYAAHGPTLRGLRDALQGRVLIDITVPLAPPAFAEVHLPPGQAAALEAQEILGPGVSVAAAMHHVSSAHLADPARAIEADVCVVANDPKVREAVMRLVADLGLNPLDAGPLRNAIALESLTPLLLHLTKRYGSSGAGVRFTNLVPKTK